MKNKKGQIQLGFIFLVAILIGVVYVLYGGSYGIQVSCEDNKILGFKKVPPPLLNMVDNVLCSTEYEVSFKSTIVCKGNMDIRSNSIIPCNDINDYEGEELKIYVKFYQGNNILGYDTKYIVFEK